jgi:hypothetical protein
VFGITNTRGLSGKSGQVSLQEALGMGGGGYNKLARHATAALLNACNNGVNYPYTVSEIQRAVRDVFNNSSLGRDNAEALGDLYDRANNAGCPLSNSRSIKVAQSIGQAGETLNLTKQVQAYPNPMSAEGLWIELPGMDVKGKVNAFIYDLNGRLVAAKDFDGNAQESRHLWNFDHSAWARGVYVLIIRNDESISRIKLIK